MISDAIDSLIAARLRQTALKAEAELLQLLLSTDCDREDYIHPYFGMLPISPDSYGLWMGRHPEMRVALIEKDNYYSLVCPLNYRTTNNVMVIAETASVNVDTSIDSKGFDYLVMQTLGGAFKWVVSPNYLRIDGILYPVKAVKGGIEIELPEALPAIVTVSLVLAVEKEALQYIKGMKS
jgi:hypothetical protein